jgi:diacylglycerol kinase (ATP)
VTVPLDPARATVIVSPRASRIRGAGARADVTRGVRDALAVRGMHEIVVSEVGTIDGVREAARAAVLAGSSVVVLAGGDGTIRDAAGVLAGTGVNVAIVPCGTGNLYASSIGLSRDLREAYRAIASGSPRPFDIGEVVVTPAGERARAATPFIVACGTGFDARLIAATSPEMKARLPWCSSPTAGRPSLVGSDRVCPSMPVMDSCTSSCCPGAASSTASGAPWN